MKSVLAIDLGATSCRGILYTIQKNKIVTKEINRFPTLTHTIKGQLSWQLDYLIHHIVNTIKIAQQDSQLISVGIDTWGVDFVLVDTNNQPLSDPVCYRDTRTNGIFDTIKHYSSLEELYFQTGNQLMEINSLFQLIACKEKTPEIYFRADKLLMLSDYINYYLTGTIACEKSIASTTQMLNPLSKQWHTDILNTFDIPNYLLPNIVSEGNILGKIHDTIAPNTLVINVCQHDTASAVAAIPDNENSLYISCGTWSLIGTTLKGPLLTQKAYHYNFTNESGLNNSTLLLKNCTGLWFVEELRRSYAQRGVNLSHDDITFLIDDGVPPACLFDTQDDLLTQPGDMIDKLKNYFAIQHITIDESPGSLFKMVYHSLAHTYKVIIQQLEEVTEQTYDSINLIGGGSKSNYFSQLIADVTGKTVITGIYEATSLGNALVQFEALGYIDSIASAKDLINDSITFHYFYPQQGGENDTLSKNRHTTYN